MKTLVIYDSAYGNTAKIAQAIAEACETKALLIKDVEPADLDAIELLIVGSPTQSGKPTEAMQAFLDELPSLENVSVAAFDTRFKSWWVKIVGNAAEKIAVALQQKGGNLVLPGEGFIVNATRGPLFSEELDRATVWAHRIVNVGSKIHDL